ncbi:MAG: hypothetical protein ABIE68_02925 [bacterium]
MTGKIIRTGTVVAISRPYQGANLKRYIIRLAEPKGEIRLPHSASWARGFEAGDHVTIFESRRIRNHLQITVSPRSNNVSWEAEISERNYFTTTRPLNLETITVIQAVADTTTPHHKCNLVNGRWVKLIGINVWVFLPADNAELDQVDVSDIITIELGDTKKATSEEKKFYQLSVQVRDADHTTIINRVNNFPLQAEFITTTDPIIDNNSN